MALLGHRLGREGKAAAAMVEKAVSAALPDCYVDVAANPAADAELTSPSDAILQAKPRHLPLSVWRSGWQRSQAIRERITQLEKSGRCIEVPGG